MKSDRGCVFHAECVMCCLACSTEKMFENLDDATKQQILPLKTVNRKASEVFGFVMNWEGTRRLDDFEAK